MNIQPTQRWWIAGITLGALSLAAFLWFSGKPHFERPDSQAQRFNYREEAAEADRKAKRTPAEWDDILHGSQLGFDWKTAQAATQERLEQLAGGQAASRSNAYGPFNASWIEKGPTGIPGRVTASAIHYSENAIYLQTDGGYLFKGSLAGSDWVCLNNQSPFATGVDARLFVFTLPNGQTRILVGGWGNETARKFLRYSDDNGQSWQTPTGLESGVWYRRTLALPTGVVYHLVHQFNGNQHKMVVFRSTDYGTSFTQFFSQNIPEWYFDQRCDMWAPADADWLFVVVNDLGFRVAADGTVTNLGAITGQASPEWAILTGGRSNTNDPYTLYLRIWDGSENGIYRSTDNGATWSHWGALPDGGLHWPFSNFAFATDPANPSQVYAGGWILGVSANGTDWHAPHDLGGYVGYHGDVPDIHFSRPPGQNTFDLYLGTDGGYYKYQPADDTFASLSLITLTNTQIYRMVSSHSAEHRMYIGTQDNGFNYNTTNVGPDNAAAFNYLWGGDVTQVVSGDKGKSFWCFWWALGCNYVDNAANMTNSAIATWGAPYDTYWELPAKVVPNAPKQCLIPSTEPGTSFLARMYAPEIIVPGQSDQITVATGTFDFLAASGGRIGAIGISPLNPEHLYVMTENGVFFWSLDNGQTWQQNETAKDKMFPRYIAVSPVEPGVVFIGGAGYGNNTPCWRTNNHGQTLVAAETPSQSLLKDNRVNGLCFDPTGLYVFAAADIGAFVYDFNTGTWELLSSSPAPLTGFHDVEYLENSNTVRFATYARGVWDFRITGLVSTTSASARPGLQLFPVPCRDQLQINLPGTAWNGTVQVQVHDQQGRLCLQQAAVAANGSISLVTSQLPAGRYYLRLSGIDARGLSASFVKL